MAKTKAAEAAAPSRFNDLVAAYHGMIQGELAKIFGTAHALKVQMVLADTNKWLCNEVTIDPVIRDILLNLRGELLACAAIIPAMDGGVQ